MQQRCPRRVLVVDLELTVWDIRPGYKDPFGLCLATVIVPVEHGDGHALFSTTSDFGAQVDLMQRLAEVVAPHVR